MPLTVRQIEAAKPGPKTITLSDGKGLALTVDPHGRKGWRFRYYRPNGKRNMMSLGPYPTVSLAEARQQAEDNRRLLARGIDPAEKRKADKQAHRTASQNTFHAIAKEWHEGMKPRWKESSKRARLTWNALELHVFPYVGDRPIAEIEPLEWLEILRKLERAEKHEQKRRVHSISGDIYRLAIVTGRATTNPVSDIGVALLPSKNKNHPHVSGEELPGLLKALSAYEGSKLVRAGLKLLVLTGARPGELRCAAWSEIDLEAFIWRIPPERMKTGRPHHVPLPRQAVAILNEIRPIAGPGPLVFPGRNDRTKPISDGAFTRALNRMGYHGRHVPHGTRHLVATQLKELGYPGEWIEAQLSHKLPGIEGVYTHAEHMAPDQRPAMMQAWADHLDALEADNVIQLATAGQTPA